MQVYVNQEFQTLTLFNRDTLISVSLKIIRMSQCTKQTRNFYSSMGESPISHREGSTVSSVSSGSVAPTMAAGVVFVRDKMY